MNKSALAALVLFFAWSGTFSFVKKPEEMIIKNKADWKKLWFEIGKPAPAEDFSTAVAVAVFLGEKPTGGWAVSFDDPVRKKSRVSVRYHISPPKGFAVEALTQPYGVRLYPKTDPTLQWALIH